MNFLEQALEDQCNKPFPHFRALNAKEKEIITLGGGLFRWYYDKIMEYGKQCDIITEIGVNVGKSGRAWLLCNPKKLIGIDIRDFEHSVRPYVKYTNVEYSFIQADSINITTEDFENTDLLFLDGNHSYKHVMYELVSFSPKVSTYILGDDIGAEGTPGPTGYEVRKAFHDFLASTNDWVLEYEEADIGAGIIAIKRKEKNGS